MDSFVTRTVVNLSDAQKHATISRDNTAGESARRANLFAYIGKKQTLCLSLSAQETVRLESKNSDEHPLFTAEETAILEALQNGHRRREIGAQRAQEIARGSAAWKSSIWAERRETLTRILERERERDRHGLKASEAQTLTEQQRERRAPTARKRSTIMQNITQNADSMASVLNRRTQASVNHETPSSGDSPNPSAAAGRLTSGWADLEALYSISGEEDAGVNETPRAEPSVTRPLVPEIHDPWNQTELGSIGQPQKYARLHSGRHADDSRAPRSEPSRSTLSESGNGIIGAEQNVATASDHDKAIHMKSPLAQWYETNDGPWIPANIAPPQNEWPKSLRMNNPSIRNHGYFFSGTYREGLSPSECDTVPPGTTLSDSGYGDNGALQTVTAASIYDEAIGPDSLPRNWNAQQQGELANLTIMQRFGKDPFCETCNKVLSTRSELRKHEQWHSKPYSCDVRGCPRAEGFSTRRDLDRHKRSKHQAAETVIDIGQSISPAHHGPVQASSYWSIADAEEFPLLLSSFGSDWTAIASYMRTKTAVMVQNYYAQQKSGKNWEELVYEAERRRSHGVVLPKPPIHNLEVKKRLTEHFERPSVSADAIREDVPPSIRGLHP